MTGFHLPINILTAVKCNNYFIFFVRPLGDVALSTENDAKNEGMAPYHFAYRVEGSAFAGAQPQAWMGHEPAHYYRFVTGGFVWMCFLKPSRPLKLSKSANDRCRLCVTGCLPEYISAAVPMPHIADVCPPPKSAASGANSRHDTPHRQQLSRALALPTNAGGFPPGGNSDVAVRQKCGGRHTHPHAL